jgi:hypothetical protein
MHTHGAYADPNTTVSPAVLELGADIGAAIIYTPAVVNGAKIEIKPRCGDWNGTHTAVRRRPGGQGSVLQCVALFYGLPAGRYDLRLRDQVRSIQIFGGRVTEETW